MGKLVDSLQSQAFLCHRAIPLPRCFPPLVGGNAANPKQHSGHSRSQDRREPKTVGPQPIHFALTLQGLSVLTLVVAP